MQQQRPTPTLNQHSKAVKDSSSPEPAPAPGTLGSAFLFFPATLPTLGPEASRQQPEPWGATKRIQVSHTFYLSADPTLVSRKTLSLPKPGHGLERQRKGRSSREANGSSKVLAFGLLRVWVLKIRFSRVILFVGDFTRLSQNRGPAEKQSSGCGSDKVGPLPNSTPHQSIPFLTPPQPIHRAGLGSPPRPPAAPGSG